MAGTGAASRPDAILGRVPRGLRLNFPVILRRFGAAWLDRESRKVAGPDDVWPDPKVPRDERLRTQPPEVLLQELTAWLTGAYPRLADVRWSFYDETRTSQVNAILREHDARWARLAGEGDKAWRTRQQALRDEFLEGRATTFHADRAVYLSEEVRTDLRGGLWERAQGARTVTHEAWHALRRDRRRFGPFEEGSADLFALLCVRSLCGAEMQATLRYPHLARAVDGLTRLLAAQAGQTQEQVLLESREVDDQEGWLHRRLEATGAALQTVQAVMMIPRNTTVGHGAWYAAVERLIQEVT